jgi:hypothetical protein
VKPGGTVDFGTLHLARKAGQSTPVSTPATTSVNTARSESTPSVVMASPAPQRDLQAEITNFVSDHLRKSADANVSGLVADYAERVDYYDDGVVDRSFIVKDRQTFAASWPSLKITPPSGLRITETPNGTVLPFPSTTDLTRETTVALTRRAMQQTCGSWIHRRAV